MILKQGEKVHIVERRRFADDVRRHFIGEVEICTEQVIRAKGYVWVFDAMSGQFVRKPEIRERIIGLVDSGLVINVIPPEVDVDALRYVINDQKGLMVTDGSSFYLEINEFTATR